MIFDFGGHCLPKHQGLYISFNLLFIHHHYLYTYVDPTKVDTEVRVTLKVDNLRLAYYNGNISTIPSDSTKMDMATNRA